MGLQAVFVFAFLIGAAPQQAPVDVLIRGGTVYDGTGAEGRTADVAIRGDRIAAVGALGETPALRTIDARGKIVCPGFIDLHSHSDEPILRDGLRENLSFVTQGCTTIVTGNCGGGHVDVGDYFEKLARAGAGTNVAHLIPQGSLRQRAMGGSFNRPPTPDEMNKMKALVERGMREGAVGISTGLIYTPGVYASTDEIVELARVVARHGGVYASHIRGEGDTLLEAVAEAIEIGRRSGCPVHISHFKASGPTNWGKVKDSCALVEKARAEGLRVTCDQYPYAASSTSLAATLFPTWAREGTDQEFIARLDDPKTGPRIREYVEGVLSKRALPAGAEEHTGAEQILIAGYAKNPAYHGKRLSEIAREAGKHPADMAIEIQRNGGASIIGFSMSEDDVKYVMRRPYVATASDGSSKLPDKTAPHPRSYGTFPRKIGRFAIEERVLPLAQAIHSATGLPAEAFAIRDRGILRPGAFADVVVFDPKTFRDRATFEKPHQFSTGAEWVFVNGKAVVADGAPTKALPGRPLKLLDTSRGDAMIAEFFKRETQALSDRCLADVRTLDDWLQRRDAYRRQLFEMLGLDPRPERMPLNAVVTGTVEQETFVVEKLHFQSRPGLYVTANLYRPRKVEGKLPAILYLCGHGQVKKDGVSYGNKVHYQHHGAWFARNGYVCLTIDTLQLGEIEGIHHGTYREGMWWWNARGYTPAGVEAWNAIRALDYLESRPEVDATKIGVTGRSGGGAYSWWVAALDERVAVAVPVAGITTLKNHVVDGVVEGHCDCMYIVNTYRWDYPLVAALVAPRPLLISNTDKDTIFPLDGVVELHAKVRRIYELYGKPKNLGLQIAEGPHADTQELHIHAFHWFNRHLKGAQPPIEMAATKFFEPEQLKVFDKLPEDQKNTTIQESFTAAAPPPKIPATQAEWDAHVARVKKELMDKCFRGWPEKPADLDVRQIFDVTRRDVGRLSAYDFTSEEGIRLRLYLHYPMGVPRDAGLIEVRVLDAEGWWKFLSMMYWSFPDELADQPRVARVLLEEPYRSAVAFVLPRAIGPTAWDQSPREQAHLRRRFMLLGQTLDAMRVWDVLRAVEALRSVEGLARVPLRLRGEREMAGIALYAGILGAGAAELELADLPMSHQVGPDLLNVMRVLDLPAAVAFMAGVAPVHIRQAGDAGWDYPRSVGRALGWPKDRLLLVDTSKK